MKEQSVSKTFFHKIGGYYLILLNLARRVTSQLNVRVENPLTWLKEITEL
jgi:hypothetical protein